MEKTKKQTTEKKKTDVAVAGVRSLEKKEPTLVERNYDGKCKDRDCHTHGFLKARGRVFEGLVKKKFPRRVLIEFERMNYVKKYERYSKSRTRIHARLPDCMDKDINVGDLIRVQECRPLSKIIHTVVIQKVKSSSENGEKK